MSVEMSKPPELLSKAFQFDTGSPRHSKSDVKDAGYFVALDFGRGWLHIQPARLLESGCRGDAVWPLYLHGIGLEAIGIL